MGNHCSHVLVSRCLLAGATALALVAGCSGSTAPPRLGEAAQELNEDQCLYFDVNGIDTICHRTGAASHPFTLIRISDQACINGHAGHAEDYVTSLDPSSPLFDPTCNGQGCLPTAAPCDGTLDCCSGSCVEGVCEDPAPAEPTIGCHRNAAGDQSLNDIAYLGPLDTANNVRFFQSNEGICVTPFAQDGSALISAANAAEAAAKCQSLFGFDVIDASIWAGMAGFWICVPGGGGAG